MSAYTDQLAKERLEKDLAEARNDLAATRSFYKHLTSEHTILKQKLARTEEELKAALARKDQLAELDARIVEAVCGVDWWALGGWQCFAELTNEREKLTND